MNKKQLEYFMETYHYRNIQVAADNLYISHQGLSRVIRSLEDELGQALFVRSNRGLEPTDFATTLLPHVQSLLDTYARIEGVQTLAGQKPYLQKLPAELDEGCLKLPVAFAAIFDSLLNCRSQYYWCNQCHLQQDEAN